MSYTTFTTYSGRIICYNTLSEEHLSLEDIAHHLTNIQRFGGCLPLDMPYSVASHSINVYRMARLIYPEEIELQRYALMHDASEAYLGDVVSGLKQCLPDYKIIESKITQLINNKYELQYFPEVHEIDKRIMLDEACNLMPDKCELYLHNQNMMPYGIDITPDKWADKLKIKLEFLAICRLLLIRG